VCLSAVAALGANYLMQSDTRRRQRHAVEDMQRESAAVETRAAQSANERVALRRRALAANSLLTGAEGATTGSRMTLGGA
jgi:hypothetical protein